MRKTRTHLKFKVQFETNSAVYLALRGNSGVQISTQHLLFQENKRARKSKMLTRSPFWFCLSALMFGLYLYSRFKRNILAVNVK